MTLNEIKKQHGAGYDAGNAAIASLFDNDLQVGKVNRTRPVYFRIEYKIQNITLVILQRLFGYGLA